jgi:hypothetical protein
MIIIYLETNSIMAIAKGRNKELEDFIYHPPDNIKFMIPSICLMESLIAIEREEKRTQSFTQNAKIEINEAQRSKEITNAQFFANYLKLSLIDYEEMSSNFEIRLLNLLEYFNNYSELIEPSFEMLKNTLNNPLFNRKKERRDNFILQVILNHAENNLAITKVFFSENSKEFGNTNLQSTFASLGINYFSNISSLKDWLKE